MAVTRREPMGSLAGQPAKPNGGPVQRKSDESGNEQRRAGRWRGATISSFARCLVSAPLPPQRGGQNRGRENRHRSLTNLGLKPSRGLFLHARKGLCPPLPSGERPSPGEARNRVRVVGAAIWPKRPSPGRWRDSTSPVPGEEG